MKCTTREACIERYGRIDFARRQWANQNDWMANMPVEDGLFNSWHGPTGSVVGHIFVNKDMEAPLQAALKSVHDRNFGALLRTYDGCFNIRMVRGTNNMFSAHSYGLAIDINADENPLGATDGGFFSYPEFVKCFTEQGFAWGGHFHGRKDPMHFSYCFEG